MSFESPEQKSELNPYSIEQIEEEKIPEKISSTSHDIEAPEGSKLETVIGHCEEVIGAIEKSTDREFIILGSMGMYLMFNELEEGKGLNILEQRIAGGKNDFDIGVSLENHDGIMTDFGWDKESKRIKRGQVSGSNEMIDVLHREDLPHFPRQEVKSGDKEFLVLSPEEMIFDKIKTLSNPEMTREGELRKGEIKWGVDIKLLKTYLMMKNDWSESELEDHLTDRWDEYVEDIRYQGVSEMIKRVNQGESTKDVLKELLEKRLKKEIDNVEEELINLTGRESEEVVRDLVNSANPKEFNQNLEELLDIRMGKRMDYREASQIANREYINLLN